MFKHKYMKIVNYRGPQIMPVLDPMAKIISEPIAEIHKKEMSRCRFGCSGNCTSCRGSCTQSCGSYLCKDSCLFNCKAYCAESCRDTCYGSSK